jgi:hypothetical protein
MGVLGLDLRRAGRVLLMNQIGGFLRVPNGGWHGQAKLFSDANIRLTDLLETFTTERAAKLIASNLDRAGRYVQVNLMLVLVSAQREAHRSLTATGTRMIDTYHQGGLDFLEEPKGRLGLPRAITKTWEAARPIRNHETGNLVYPEWIPARRSRRSRWR